MRLRIAGLSIVLGLVAMPCIAGADEPSASASPPVDAPSSAEDPPLEGFEPPPPPSKPLPWSIMAMIGGAASFGKDAYPTDGVYGPQGAVHLAASVSIWHVYVGGGFSGIFFRDENAYSVDVVEVGNPQNTKTSDATAIAMAGWGEIGGTYTFSFALEAKDRYFELVPSLGYGWEGVGDISRGAGCSDCSSKTFPVDYQGGHFLRLGVGTYYGFLDDKGTQSRIGLTTSYQRFLLPGDARLTNQLAFWFTVGWGRLR